MKKIIYSTADGRLHVVHPVINTIPVREQITEDEALARSWKKLPANAIAPTVIEADKVPSDRSYRDAWVADGNGIAHDMAKAREIHRCKMRDARKPKLAALDVEQLRGRNVETQKQTLRDVTAAPAIEAATTVDALKAIWPDCLK